MNYFVTTSTQASEYHNVMCWWLVTKSLHHYYRGTDEVPTDPHRGWGPKHTEY